MKRSPMSIGNILALLLLVGLSIVFVPLLQAILREAPTSIQVTQHPLNTPAGSVETALAIRPLPQASPTAEGYPYPPPAATQPLPPTPTPIVLPPLPTYPPPGQFSDVRLMYTNSRSPGYYLVNVDGTGVLTFTLWTRLINQQVGGLAALRISPDGSKFLFSAWDNQAYDYANAMSIWLSNPDGSEPYLLVTKNETWFPEDGIWSPNGDQIAYRRAYLAGSYREGAPTSARELWVMNRDGTNHRKVLEGAPISNIEIGTTALVFFWSRNGYIYFATRDRELYAVNPDDGALFLLLSDVDPLDLHASLSPSGQHVALTHDLSAQAIAQRGLIPVDVPGDFTSWSPDGSHMIFLRGGIWMRDLTTGIDRLLVSDVAAANPSLSPDNRFLAYQTDAGLFVVDVNSGESNLIIADPREPTHGDKAIRFQFWIPVP